MSRKRESLLGSSRVVPMKAGENIKRGFMVALSAGLAIDAVKAANLIVIGLSDESIDNTNGADLDKSIKVDRRIFVLENDDASPVERTHIGQDCYILDNHTVTSDATGSSVAGRVFNVDAQGVSVEFY